METSRLVPFIREGLDILFVGLNPANGSDDNGHYFSVNQAFWCQLYKAGLIAENVDKSCADNEIFGTNEKNYNNWSYGITDLVPHTVNSDSRKVESSKDDCENLKKIIEKYAPKVAVFLHGDVKSCFLDYLKIKNVENEFGELGQIIENCLTMFYSVPFPHGNNIKSEIKIKRYEEIKKFLEEG